MAVGAKVLCGFGFQRILTNCYFLPLSATYCHMLPLFSWKVVDFSAAVETQLCVSTKALYFFLSFKCL